MSNKKLLKTHEGRLKYWTDAAKEVMLGKKIGCPLRGIRGGFVGAIHTNQDVSVLPVIRKC